jgi:hypothetical protein
MVIAQRLSVLIGFYQFGGKFQKNILEGAFLGKRMLDDFQPNRGQTYRCCPKNGESSQNTHISRFDRIFKFLTQTLRIPQNY